MFKQYNENNAPEKSKPFLAATKASFGMIPNLERTMAALPELLATYSFAWEQFSSVSLNKIEQQVVYQTVNFENECNYCVPWHTLISIQVGMKPEIINSLREGASLSDHKLQALSVFTKCLIHNKGKATQAELNAFFDAGYDNKDALSVVLGIAIKIMSNFTNSIAETPLDNEVNKYHWIKNVSATE